MTYDPEWYKQTKANAAARLQALKDAERRLKLELERQRILRRLKEIDDGTISFAE